MHCSRCPYCMTKLTSESLAIAVCTHCAGHIDTENPSYALPIGETLGERYTVGALLEQNGEGLLYMAYDNREDVPVLVREYFPKTLAQRRSDGWAETSEAHLLAYKSLLFDFVDIHKLVQEHGKSFVLPVQDIFLENGTAYAVLQGQMYAALLHEGAAPNLRNWINGVGELPLMEAKRLILQLCSALTPIHMQGVIHGGVSPNSICVDYQPSVSLYGFSTISLRTMNTDIPCELFDGFAAPEQYDPSKWQGSWTDVYALGAVLYYMLTGKVPPSARERQLRESYIPLEKVLPELPANIVKTVNHALILEPEQRIQSIEEFSAGILQTIQGSTSIFTIHAGERPALDDATRVIGVTSVDGTALFTAPPAQKAVPKMPRSQKHSRAFWAGCAGLGAVAIVGFAVLLSSQLNGTSQPSPNHSESARAPVPEPHYVPSLEGRHIDAILGNAEWTRDFEIQVRYDYHDSLPEGIVIRQGPQSGVHMLNRGIIILTVSRGPQKVPMPAIIGSSVDFALRTLSEEGIPFVVIESEEYDEGVVGSTSFAPDQLVDKVNDIVEVYIGMRDVEHIEDMPDEEIHPSDAPSEPEPDGEE